MLGCMSLRKLIVSTLLLFVDASGCLPVGLTCPWAVHVHVHVLCRRYASHAAALIELQRMRLAG